MAKLDRRLLHGLLSLGAAIAVAVAGYWWLFGRAPATPSARAPVGCIDDPPAQIGGPVSLKVAETGASRPADLKGKPTLLYFGFTHCPDICPTTLYDVADALKGLGPGATNIQTALVSLDPDRDTPEALSAYVRTDGFPQGLIGLTGSQSEIDAAAKAFAVSYRREALGDDYTISHTSFLYVLDRDWRLRSMISTIGASPETIAACVRAGLGADLR